MKYESKHNCYPLKGGASLFYWSFENFKMVENEFECQIKTCCSFLPFSENKLEHGAFTLENGKHYYVIEGMLGFHIFEVSINNV